MKKIINISEQFSRSPAGRYIKDGPYSGEAFRTGLLVPALNEAEEVEVQLDGALGFGSSFLEEAFGGLVRVEHVSKHTLEKKLKISSRLKIYEKKIWKYISDASV